MITTINEWKNFKLNESEEKPFHNIFVPTRLDTRDIERAKQLTAQFYKQLESTPNEVTGELLKDLLKFNLQFKIPNNLIVNGNLDLSNTLITSLPNNLIVNDSLWLTDTLIAKNKELLDEYKKKYKIVIYGI